MLANDMMVTKKEYHLSYLEDGEEYYCGNDPFSIFQKPGVTSLSAVRFHTRPGRDQEIAKNAYQQCVSIMFISKFYIPI